jgi:hypothetical protein
VIVRTLGRLIMVPLGLLLAMLASLVVLVTLGLELTTRSLTAAPGDADKLEVLVDMGIEFVTLTTAASILPAILVVAVGEIGRIRSLLYYVVGGGIALALMPFLARIGMVEGLGAVPTRVWTVLATAGFAGGLAYWLVAGRRA